MILGATVLSFAATIYCSLHADPNKKYTLLNGEFFSTGEFPKSYLIKNLFFRLPEYVIISYLVFIILFFQISRQFSKTFTSFNLKILLILFVVFFPNILIVFSPYPLYDGIRLFLFIIPYIAVIPSVMIYYLYKNSTATLNKIFSIILIIFTAFFAFNFFNLTPYQYVYLNAFAGKISDHSKKFENDYWGISTKKLISKIRNNQEILKSNNIKFTTN